MTDTTPTAAAQQATIGRRIVHVMQGATRIIKDKQMEGGAQKYKYVSHDQVVECVRALMCEAGIVMQQRIVEQKTELQTVDGKYGARTQMFTSLTMEFDFCSADDMDDKVTVQSLGHGIDAGDKSPGKAMSYCKKYAILQGFMLSTGDDPDHDQDTQQGQPTRAERQQAPPVQQEKPAPAERVDWGALCNARAKECAENGLKDDATTIWKASRMMKESPQVLAIKLKALLDQSEQVLNGDDGEAQQ